MIAVVSKQKVKPDKVEEFRKAITEQAPKTRSDKGCVSMKVIQSPDQFTFMMDEVWESMELFEEHLKGPGLAEFGAKIADFVDGDVEPFFGEIFVEV